jgi:hypothetical protein
MWNKKVGASAIKSMALLVVLGSTYPAAAQDAATPYPHMAPIDQYLMTDQDSEIILARSAAPKSISGDAEILVLTKQGYMTAVQGKNGFVCMVARGWVGGFDWPEFWNPRVRGAECLNPPAARTILPLTKMRTTMVLAGRSQTEIIASLKEALKNGKVPKLEPGAMSYMMSKASYLTDEGDHNGSHLMSYLPISDPAIWGADLPGSPVGSGPYWFTSEKMSQAFKGFPPIHIFVVYVPSWSDGTEAPRVHLH